MIAQLNDIAQIWWQWMAGMFWQVSLFIIIITLLDMAIRRWAWPQVRYVLWGLVFIKLIIPPTWQMPTSIISWIQPKVEEQISIQITPMEVTADYQEISTSSLPSSTQVTELVAKTEKASWQAIILLIWLTGMITFSMMLIIKMSRLPKRSKTQDGQNIPEWFNELLAKTAQGIKLRKTPTLVFSKHVKSPAVYGILKPVLLLPEGCLDYLSKEQTEHVLVHELCHLKRGDLLVHWFCLFIQVIYWFNPLLIWTRRQMRHVCEICCDLSVADILRERTRDYRETLLATARELLTETVEPGLGLLGVFEEPFRLVTRLKWLEKKTWENRGRKIAATIITSLVMVLFVMPMTGTTQSADQVRALRIQLGANPLESHEKYRIDSEKLEIDPIDSSINCTGNVRLALGSMIVNADSMTIFNIKNKDTVNEPDAFSIQSFSATGYVEIELEDIILTSGNAVYDSEAEMVVLTDDPIFYKGTEIIAGDVISINCAAGLITVEVPDGVKTSEGSNYNVNTSRKVQDGINAARSTIYYDALIMEVDADKELDFDGESIILPPPGSQLDEGDLIERVEGISVSAGNQIEENKHLSFRMGVRTEKTDEGGHYDIERVGTFSGPWSPLDSEPHDLPPDAYDNMSARGAVTTEVPTLPFSISLFKDVISIGEESFSDIEDLFASMKKEAGVNILVTPQTITSDGEVIQWSADYDKTPIVSLGIRSEVINGGGVQKMIFLNINPQDDVRPMDMFSCVVGPITTIEEGGAMVMICDLKILANSMNEEYTESGKKLYVFLTPHVENL